MPLHLLCQGSGRTKAGERNWGNPAFVPDRQPDHAGPSCDRNHWTPLEAGRPATVFRLYRGPWSRQSAPTGLRSGYSGCRQRRRLEYGRRRLGSDWRFSGQHQAGPITPPSYRALFRHRLLRACERPTQCLLPWRGKNRRSGCKALRLPVLRLPGLPGRENGRIAPA